MFNFGENNMIWIVLLLVLFCGGGFHFGGGDDMIILIAIGLFLLCNNGGIGFCEAK